MAETLNYSLTSRCAGSKDAYFANDKAMGANTKQLSEHALTGDIKTRSNVTEAFALLANIFIYSAALSENTTEDMLLVDVHM